MPLPPPGEEVPEPDELELEPAELTEPFVKPFADASEDGVTWGMVSPKKASRTFLKFSALSMPPSNAPVPQGYE